MYVTQYNFGFIFFFHNKKGNCSTLQVTQNYTETFPIPEIKKLFPERLVAKVMTFITRLMPCASLLYNRQCVRQVSQQLQLP